MTTGWMNVTLKHETHGELQAAVSFDATKPIAGQYGDMADAALEIAAERFDTEDVFEIDGMTVISDLQIIRYAVLTHYRYGGGTWDDSVDAPTPEAAKFYAQWETTLNESREPTMVDDFEEHLNSIHVEHCYPEPVTKHEALAVVAAYQEFHDKISEAIKSGRITKSSCPDDFQYIRDTLERIGNMPGNVRKS